MESYYTEFSWYISNSNIST